MGAAARESGPRNCAIWRVRRGRGEQDDDRAVGDRELVRERAFGRPERPRDRAPPPGPRPARRVAIADEECLHGPPTVHPKVD